MLKQIVTLTLVCLTLSGCVKNTTASQPHTKSRSYNNDRTSKIAASSIKRDKSQEIGNASWYGKRFNRKRTSSGERFNMYQMTAAHKTLPLNTYVKVTNLKNGKNVVVKINDRGPFIRNRSIDLSYAAAKKIGLISHGVAPVSIKVVKS